MGPTELAIGIMSCGLLAFATSLSMNKAAQKDPNPPKWVEPFSVIAGMVGMIIMAAGLGILMIPL